MNAPRHQLVDALHQQVPVAQQVEQHHRNEQQVGDQGEKGEAAPAERVHHAARQVVVAAERFARHLLERQYVELEVEVELRLVGGGAGPLLPKECMRRAVRHVLKVFEKRAERDEFVMSFE